MCVFPLSEGEQVTAETVDEKAPEVTTANTVPPSEKEVSVSSVTKAAPGEISITPQITQNKHTLKNKVEEHHRCIIRCTF